MSPPNELRLFISSTFRDLHEEREELVKKVFPKIRALCRDRGVRFVDIDLRWGLTDDEKLQGRVVGSCLEEIDRCRPWFLAIIGDRYGWRPSISDVEADDRVMEHYPWVVDSIAQNLSLVEIECEHGVLRDPARSTNARFYFRRERMQGVDGATESLRQLKMRISESGSTVRNFATPGDLAGLIYHDLVEMIDSAFPESATSTPLDDLQIRQRRVSWEGTQAYVAPAGFLDRVDHMLAGDSRPLQLVAPMGRGKSAFAANWAAHHLALHSDRCVVLHHVEAAAPRFDRRYVIRHAMLAAAEHYGLTSPTSPSPNFDELLELLAGREMTLILDGIEHLEPGDRTLDWLPLSPPESLQIVLTCRQPPPSLLFPERDWPTLELPELGPEERRRVATKFLGQFHKQPDETILRRILGSGQSENLLFLRTMLEELRVFGSHELLADHVEHLLGAETPEMLIDLVLARLEEGFSRLSVRNVLRALSIAEEGLSIDELSELTGLAPLEVSQMLDAAPYGISESLGRYLISHTGTSTVIGRRYAISPPEALELHRSVAAVLLAEGRPERRAEGLHHLYLGKDSESLRRELFDAATDEIIADEERIPLLTGIVQDDRDLSSDWSRVVMRRVGEREESEGIRILLALRHLLHDVGLTDLAEVALRLALGRAAGMSTDPEGVIPTLYRGAITHYFHTRNSARALPLAVRLTELAETIEDEVSAACDYATVRMTMGELAGAETTLRSLLDRAETSTDVTTATKGMVVNTLASVLHRQNRYREAAEMALAAAELLISGSGPDQHLAIYLSNAAIYTRLAGEIPAACRYGEMALEMTERTYGPYHLETARALTNLGFSNGLSETHLGAALDCLYRSLEIRQMYLPDTDHRVYTTIAHIGRAHHRRGETEEARRHLTRAIELASLETQRPSKLLIDRCRQWLAGLEKET